MTQGQSDNPTPDITPLPPPPPLSSSPTVLIVSGVRGIVLNSELLKAKHEHSRPDFVAGVWDCSLRDVEDGHIVITGLQTSSIMELKAIITP